MAERRMFTQKITESDAFLEMPLSSQTLYFHFCMNADDDGFVNNPNRIQRLVGASEDDKKVLIAKSFVIPFENGVFVIKHWRMHNLLRKDRYKPTEYLDEKSMLYIKPNGSYTLDETQGVPLLETDWQPNGNQMTPQYSIGKDSIDKNSINTHSAHAHEENDFEKRLNEFCNKWQVKIDNYSPLLADLDFEKLDTAYLESAKFLQVAPVARCISWVIKNAVSIYNGKYKDKPTGGGDNNSGETKQKGYWDDFLDSIGRLE